MPQTLAHVAPASTPDSVPCDEDQRARQRELVALIDRDLARRGVTVADPLPSAPVGMVLPEMIPITGNVLIPLGRTISRLGVVLRLLKPGF